MVKLIIGVKGTGKTKTLIDMVNEAVKMSSGCVVCIEKGQKLKFDVTHKARLIDTIEYDISSAEALYGLVCGLYAENYDITHVFIDSALKICGEDEKAFAHFLEMANKVSDRHNFQCVITASASLDELPDDILKYAK